jgi:phage shock protein PspC (stress-responsive transcriptional regulator)
MVEIAVQAHHEGMETTNGQPWAAPGNDRPPRLGRHTSDRMLGGVAGGTATYLGVGPVVVRIALVVLTLFGGLGIILYVVGWLLIPEDGKEVSLAQQALSDRGSGRHRWMTIVIALVALLVLITGGVFTAVALSGVPIHGGVGGS